VITKQEAGAPNLVLDDRLCRLFRDQGIGVPMHLALAQVEVFEYVVKIIYRSHY
jgi:hypothetical protein